MSPPRAVREPVEVPEPRRRDLTMDRLVAVRGQRLERYERERLVAQSAWRAARARLREHKLATRGLRAAADAQWQQARRDFFAMAIGSAAYQGARGAYARMRGLAAAELLAWREAHRAARQAGAAYAAARAVLRQARRAQEKLTLLRDEARRAAMPAEE